MHPMPCKVVDARDAHSLQLTFFVMPLRVRNTSYQFIGPGHRFQTGPHVRLIVIGNHIDRELRYAAL
jgi:hypothetical protein